MKNFEDRAAEFINGKEINKLVQLLSEKVENISPEDSLMEIYNTIKRTELLMGSRKPTIGIYDYSYQSVGEAQRYSLTIVEALKNTFDVTIIASKPVKPEDLSSWYNLDLEGCKVKIVPIPFYEESSDSENIDPAEVSTRILNPFHIISRETLHYDLFINSRMLEKVFPMSPVSMMICHFPERLSIDYFYSHRYTSTICSSSYGMEWALKRWSSSINHKLPLPVDIPPLKRDKSKIILGIAPFTEDGAYKQIEMVEAFIKLNSKVPQGSDWKLILAGDSSENNRYLDQLKKLIKENGTGNIELRINISPQEVGELYGEASIFWNLKGLGENSPSKVDYFGTTTIEAMGNSTVPVVFDGGVNMEILEEGVNGFKVSTAYELMKRTAEIIQKPEILSKTAESAYQRSLYFSKESFKNRAEEIGKELYQMLLKA